VWRPPSPVLVAVAIGGSAGATSRYLLGLLFPDHAGGFPWTTFVINVTGCLAIGVLAGVLDGHRVTHPLVHPLLGPGFLGGYTTLSTYADQTRALLVAGRWGVASAYVIGTLAAALPAVWLGLRLVDRLRLAGRP